MLAAREAKEADVPVVALKVSVPVKFEAVESWAA
ncbi:MAG: hypothetical protein FD126_560 [Elusimicrobia bacterium]|nr:MAG: hypothetical protein FD126_560 [Elusimicrobiota bacterium]